MTANPLCPEVGDAGLCRRGLHHRGEHRFGGRPVPKVKCPTPGKHRFPFEESAIRAALGASRTYGKSMRHYRCECGVWHITSLVRSVDSSHGRGLRGVPAPGAGVDDGAARGGRGRPA